MMLDPQPAAAEPTLPARDAGQPEGAAEGAAAIEAEAALPLPLLAFVRSLIMVGLFARVVPLFDAGGRLLRQFPTEDGYLMLTIARNIALGHGMSTAAGTIPTNGTQPLFTLIEAACFFIAGGDRTIGVALALICQVALATFTAFLLFRLAQQALHRHPRIATRAAALAAAGWYASPIVVPHSMNCLETGLYGALLVSSVFYWHRMWLQRAPQRAALRSALILGGLLGLTFWARIDAIFLIGAITLTNAGMALRDGWPTLRARLQESFVAGAVSVVVASPWLIYNQLGFGSLMPISGQSESYGVQFGTNLAELPSKLLEYSNLVVPIPLALERVPAYLLFATMVVVVYAAIVAASYRRLQRDERALFWVVVGFSLLVIGYYGLLFGASHFVGRYMFPLSPFTALFTATLLVWAFDRWAPSRAWLHKAALAGAAVALLLMVGLQLRFYRNGAKHQHFQVVEWVEHNVPDSAWVAAIQTGTLGFFHDRTVNLDGKVNPEAMRMRRVNRVLDYVVDNRFGPERARIEYMADWAGAANLVDREPLASHFEKVVQDYQADLGVLRRRK